MTQHMCQFLLILQKSQQHATSTGLKNSKLKALTCLLSCLPFGLYIGFIIALNGTDMLCALKGRGIGHACSQGLKTCSSALFAHCPNLSAYDS